MLLFLIGKLGITSAFSVIFVHTAEMFPTVSFQFSLLHHVFLILIIYIIFIFRSFGVLALVVCVHYLGLELF